MQLDPAAPTPALRMPVHSSLAATAAWRYAQLLAALPRRSTEASSWQQFAAAQLPKGQTAKSILGSLEVLKGGADSSRDVVVDMLLLRALPCF